MIWQTRTVLYDLKFNFVKLLFKTEDTVEGAGRIWCQLKIMGPDPSSFLSYKKLLNLSPSPFYFFLIGNAPPHSLAEQNWTFDSTHPPVKKIPSVFWSKFIRNLLTSTRPSLLSGWHTMRRAPNQNLANIYLLNYLNNTCKNAFF